MQDKKREAAKREAEIERNAKLATVEKANNRLKRQTPFLCDIRFRNDLPQVPLCSSPLPFCCMLYTALIAASWLTPRSC